MDKFFLDPDPESILFFYDYYIWSQDQEKLSQ